MDKQINTFRFKIDGNLVDSSAVGVFNILQNYSGNGLIADGVSFRDDEKIDISYFYPLNSTAKIGLFNYGSYISDQRSNTLSELQRFGSLAQLSLSSEYDLLNSGFLTHTVVKLAYGLENNERLQVLSTGQRALFSLQTEGNDENTRFSIQSANDYLTLNMDRVNFESKSDLAFTEQFDYGDQVDIHGFYNLIDRDLLGRLTENQKKINPGLSNTIEDRTESRLGGQAQMKIKVTDWLKADLSAKIANAKISRNYRNSINGLDISDIIRRLDESELGFSGKFVVEADNLSSIGGMRISTRKEMNTTERNFDISSLDFENLRNLESLRDNSQFNTGVFSNTVYRASEWTTLNLDFSLNRLQYDTPSEKNNDDRDELTYNISTGLNYKFSEYLNYGLELTLFANHFVYLRSEYSAQNRWNRILSLNQSFQYSSQHIMYHPRIAIIANYTAFDYESYSQNVNSFSLRQINYTDSTRIKIAKNFNLESTILIRYYERGLLYWNDFEETPENANFERFVKLMMIKQNEEFNYGLGMRIYNLEQTRIGPGAINNFGNFEQFSFGPEALIQINFASGNFFRLTGWYEFQNTVGLGKQEVPNIFLTSNIVF